MNPSLVGEVIYSIWKKLGLNELGIDVEPKLPEFHCVVAEWFVDNQLDPWESFYSTLSHREFYMNEYDHVMEEIARIKSRPRVKVGEVYGGRLVCQDSM